MDKESEEIYTEAKVAICTLGQKKDVMEFLKACAINVTAMEMDGDTDGMEFCIAGQNFNFRRV